MAVSNPYYQFDLTDRRRCLADAGFTRDDLRIWFHPDGRGAGEGVLAALTDGAFFRYLGIEPPEPAAEVAEILSEISIT